MRNPRHMLLAAVLTGLLVTSLPARADIITRIIINDAQGGLTNCGILGSSSGCTGDLEMYSGIPWLSVCAAVTVGESGTSAGDCQFNNNRTPPGPGTGTATISNSACTAFKLEMSSFGNLWFEDGGGRSWKVIYLVMNFRNGAPSGAGYAWDLDTSKLNKFTVTDPTNAEIHHVFFKSADLASSLACGAVRIRQFTFHFTADSVA